MTVYDSEGSRLFECITKLPEYYPARVERGILTSFAGAMIAAACHDHSRPLRLLELGAGTAAKTGILLEAAARRRDELIYLPIDVSSDALEAACDSIGGLFPSVRLQPTVANYVVHPPALEWFKGATLAIYIGPSIGNVSPHEAAGILRNLRSELRPGDALLLGTDLVKDAATLVQAYDDRAGVTAAFNLNILHRLNRELGADFDTGRFRHRARGMPQSPESRCTSRVRAPRIATNLRGIRSELCSTAPAFQSSIPGRTRGGGMRLRSRLPGDSS